MESYFPVRKRPLRRRLAFDDESEGAEPQQKPSNSSLCKVLALTWEGEGTLPCREDQVAAITEFLEQAEERTAGSIYLSGVPGTGKTASVNLALRVLEKKNEVEVIQLNAFRLASHAKDFFKVLAEEIDEVVRGGKNTKATRLLLKKAITANSQGAEGWVREQIVKPGKQIVLIIDEVDQLVTTDCSVLYFLYELPYLTRSRLSLITIANTLSFADTHLQRLHVRGHFPVQLHFKPYTAAELQKIICQRVETACNDQLQITPSAIEYCARRISAVTGDVRKALDVCRHAVEQLTTPKGRYDAENRHVVAPPPNELKFPSGGSQCGTPTRETFLSAAAETPMRRPYSRWNKENDDIVSATPRRLAKGQVTIGQVSRLLSSGAFFGSRLTGTNENEDGNSVVPFQQKVVLCTMLLLLQKRGRHSATLAELESAYRFVCRERHVTPESDLFMLCQRLDDRGLISLHKNKSNTRNSKITFRFTETEVDNYASDKAFLTAILSLKLPQKC